MMEVTVHLPDDIAQHLQEAWHDLPRSVLEGIALKGYCAGLLTTEEVRQLLGLETRFDVQAFLAKHGVPFYTYDELKKDLATLDRLKL